MLLQERRAAEYVRKALRRVREEAANNRSAHDEMRIRVCQTYEEEKRTLGFPRYSMRLASMNTPAVGSSSL